jgi:hypothetical protein
MKIFPIAAKAEPRRQKTDIPTYSRSLSHTPEMTKAAPMMKEIRIPCLLMSQLQGKEKRG